MVRLKRGISFLLALTICFGFMLPYAGRISASEKEEDRTVCLALSEHGRMRFADSKEEANEQTRVYQEGDTVTLAIEPEDGFCLGQIRLLDAVTKEELPFETPEGEENEFSFRMGDHSVVVHAVFQQIEENAGDEITMETPEKPLQEEPEEEKEEEEYRFPPKG